MMTWLTVSSYRRRRVVAWTSALALLGLQLAPTFAAAMPDEQPRCHHAAMGNTSTKMPCCQEPAPEHPCDGADAACVYYCAALLMAPVLAPTFEHADPPLTIAQHESSRNARPPHPPPKR
jgi:hypothetical protein